MDVSSIVIPHLKTQLYPHQIQMVSAMKQHALRMTQGFCYNQELVRGKLGIVADPWRTRQASLLPEYPMVEANVCYVVQ